MIKLRAYTIKTLAETSACRAGRSHYLANVTAIAWKLPPKPYVHLHVQNVLKTPETAHRTTLPNSLNSLKFGLNSR